MADLPKGHWIHSAMAKEKARIGKKKGAVGGKGQDTPKPEAPGAATAPVKSMMPPSQPAPAMGGGVVRPGPLSGSLKQPGVFQ